jgi:hypothetical protein
MKIKKFSKIFNGFNLIIAIYFLIFYKYMGYFNVSKSTAIRDLNNLANERINI